MKLTMPGTGNALVTECYNTCFVIEEKGSKYYHGNFFIPDDLESLKL